MHFSIGIITTTKPERDEIIDILNPMHDDNYSPFCEYPFNWDWLSIGGRWAECIKPKKHAKDLTEAEPSVFDDNHGLTAGAYVKDIKKVKYVLENNIYCILDTTTEKYYFPRDTKELPDFKDCYLTIVDCHD